MRGAPPHDSQLPATSATFSAVRASLAAMHAPRPRSGPLVGVLYALIVVGSLVFSVVAQMTDPPLPPADSLMRWQAVWSGGTYGLKYTFAVTWFCTLVALLGPLMVIATIHGAVTGPARRDMPVGPAWTTLVAREGGARRLLIGAGFLAVGLVFGGACLLDPFVLEPVGLLAKIVLLLWPFTFLAGPFLILDVALPSEVVVVTIRPGELVRITEPSERHVLRHADRTIELPFAAWSALTPGDTVAVRISAAMQDVRELARRSA